MPDDAYLENVTLGGRKIADGWLDFSHGLGGERLGITVNRGGGEVGGEVLDEKAEAAAGLVRVFLAADSAGMDRGSVVTSDGRFNFKAVPPGKYRIVAVDLSEMTRTLGPVWNTARVMERLFDSGEQIEVRPAGRISKNLLVLRRMPEKKEAP
jgi:hypothetical protein